MTDFRRDELRHVLWSTRKARESLREGRLAEAVRHWGNAVRGLAFARGALSGGPDGVRLFDCTARLRRTLDGIGFEIESAVREALGKCARGLASTDARIWQCMAGF